MATVHMLTTADERIAGYSSADFRRLSEAAAVDAFGTHQLVPSPDDADVILFVGSSYPDHRDVRAHPLVQRHREKCFLFQSDDHVIAFLPGVYVNVGKRWHNRRTITGPYLQMAYWNHVSYVPFDSDCRYLYCFVGSSRTHAIRRAVMKLMHPRGYLEDTSVTAAQSTGGPFDMVAYRQEDKTRYGEVISQSKFVLCPRGYGCSTWRLFEALKAGRVPVIISDQWVEPAGPAWETFSIRVKQRDVADVPKLLESRESEAEEMARNAREVWEQWFSKETVFHRIVDWCVTLKSRAPSSTIEDIVAYSQLLRPFYVRHVLLPGAKQLLATRLARVRSR